MTENYCAEDCIDGTPCERPAGWGLEPDIGPCKDHLKGRPSKFTEDRRDTILESASKGLSMAGCARAAGVPKQTLHDWLQNHEDFSDAFKRARNEGEERIVRDGLYNPDADSSFAKFLLATSFDYVKTEKRKHEHSGEGGRPLMVIERDSDDATE